MDVQQDSTKTNQPTDINNTNGESIQTISDKQQMYIDFTAVSGLFTSDDGELKPMKVSEFASLIGVERTTLHYWKKRIPDFWDRVRERRLQIGSQARTNKVWNGIYLRAAKGDAEQAKIWLSTFDGWQPPSQKHEMEIGGGLADLLNKTRQLAEQNKPKVIDIEPTTNNNAS